ncbi:unnamed protein product, partial [Mesorhabditis belari]|uniref:Fibrinogen C-terminal domain-containing protein n=1 Tax=Mesorhabditis belari TaxID=2138241 RepID=A0AAF3FN10_9BILA
MRLLIVLLLLGDVLGEYSLTIYLRRLDVGQGYLLSGDHCTDTWNLGDQCNLQLKLGVCLGVPLDVSNPCPNPTPIDLFNVTSNSNAVDFAGGGTIYGGWKNPSVFPDNSIDAIYAGFSLFVEIREARGGAIIDSYQQQFDNGNTPNNFMYFSHPRNLLDPTMLSVAWKATGNLPTPPPPPTTTEAPTPTHTTATEPSTEEPPSTSAPITAKDCEEVESKTDGVYPILINGQIVQVYCSFASNVALTHIQGRGEKDSTDFDVTFDKYKEPIGDADKGNNFWLGLDNINQLTAKNDQSYSLMIEVCCGDNSISKQYYTEVQRKMGVAKYSDRDLSLLFPVSDSSTGYVLTGKATLGIGLNYADNTDGYGTDLGRKFVTYDSWKDNDDNEYCKVIYDGPNYTEGSGGWWFGNCRENLNGHYYEAAVDLDPNCKITVPSPLEKRFGNRVRHTKHCDTGREWSELHEDTNGHLSGNSTTYWT